MFVKLSGAWGASSSEGFTVIRGGSPMTGFYIEYSQGERGLRLTLENLMPGSVQPIFADHIGPWLPPHAQEELSQGGQRKIAQRIVEAMQFLGDRFAVA